MSSSKAADRQREMLEERQRIDAAMATIDAAKRKALAQREEYGRYLKWKVKMQHRERKQREEEEKALRSRIDDRLKKVLEEHRERKREETDLWRSYADAAPDRKAPESLARRAARMQGDAEKEAHRQAQSEKRAVSKRAPHSAPTKQPETERTRHGYEPVVPRRGGPPALQSTTNESASRRQSVAGRGNNNGGDEDGLTFASETEFQAAFPLPTVPARDNHTAAVTGPAAGVKALTVAQAKTIATIDGQRKRVARNERLVKDMYETAKTRKLYSTARMLADPPADFMIGADLMRYMPADVMDTVDRDAAPRPPASPRQDVHSTAAFFITEDGRQGGVPGASDLLAGDPEEVHHQGTTGSPRGTHGGGIGRSSRWKSYDPHAWIHAKTGGAGAGSGGVAPLVPRAPDATPPRNREEEANMLMSYREKYEPLTKIKKRTERHTSHTWTQVDHHRLPPLAPAKFIDK